MASFLALTNCGGGMDGDAGSDARADTGHADSAPDARPDAGPDAHPDAHPDAASDATPDATPDAAPDATPDAGMDASDDTAMPDVVMMMDAPADTTPDAAPDAAPDAPADAAPDAPTTDAGPCTGMADGTACDDGNACTQNDTCLSGVCTGGAAVVCPSSDGCHPAACNPSTGACATTVACQLYGVGSIPGTAHDGLVVSPTTLEDGTPNNQIGALGSAIAYTGVGNLYIATPDRGPNAGLDSFTDRYYLIDLSLAGGEVTPTVVGAATLNSGPGLASFTGLSTAFDATGSPASLRLDPEGVRVTPTGTFFVSDEYGPYVYEFAPNGDRLRSLVVPSKFLIAHPNANSDSELPPGNTSGRQANRGMEGLAISPDGSTLFGLMQSPLIQDGALNSSNHRIGTNVRLLQLDVATGATHEYLYPLESASYGISEIVAVDSHRFLVDERDGNGGVSAAFKRLFLIDVSAATDISAVDTLPTTGIPAGVTAVAKSPFLDLLGADYGLAGASFPEKIEGLAFGPDLPDGRHTLVITNDNDFVSGADNHFMVFAIDPAALPGFVPQTATWTGSCGGATPVTCAPADACHVAGVCDPGTGACTNPPAPAGAACTTGGANGTCDGSGNCNASAPAVTSFRVVRVGDGSAALTSASTAVFVEERGIDGALLGTVALPTAASGANQPLTVSGSATSEGGISRSADGRYLVLPGYAVAPGTASIAGTASSSTHRGVARIDAAGVVDTSTQLDAAFNANNPRGAASVDGTGFWLGGAGGATGGVWYVALGATGGTQVVATPNNVRWLQVVGAQLFGSSSSGTYTNVFAVSGGIPTTTGQTATSFPGMPTSAASPYGFVLLDLSAAVAGPDTLYVADDRSAATGGGVQKWAFDGTSWMLAGTLNLATSPVGFRGVAGYAGTSGVTLLASTADSSGNRLVAFVDDGSTTPVGNVVATAGANTIFRGVALSPHE